jgi:hypothetical protein
VLASWFGFPSPTVWLDNHAEPAPFRQFRGMPLNTRHLKLAFWPAKLPIKTYKQLKTFLILCATLAAAHCHAGFFSKLVEASGQTNNLTLTNAVAGAASTNSPRTLLSDEVASLKNSQLSQSLTTNQFAQLLSSLQAKGTNASPTTNWSELAAKLNAMFGNHFNLSNTNQWMQLVNSALASRTQLVSTNQLAQLLSTNSVSAATNQPAAAVSQALDWLKPKK